MFRILTFWPLLLFLSHGCTHVQTCPDEVAAAFDIGSGSTKVQVVERNSCSLKISQTLLKTSIAVGYAQDLSSGKKAFSQKIVLQGEQALKNLMKKSLVYHPEKVFGVATQAFRQAKNGAKVLENWHHRYGWPFKIIDQRKEAMLAYELVVLKLDVPDEKKLMVWDIGGGSQQVVTMNKNKTLNIFKSKLAAVTFKNKVIELLQRPSGTLSPNPMKLPEIGQSLELARNIIRSELNPDVLNNIKSSEIVIGLGGVHGASIKNQLGLQDGERITLEGIERAIMERIGLSDDQIGGDYASTDLTNLILIKGLMLEYDLKSYTPISTSLTESLLRQIP
jgi:exopolyphosphatase/guanosine-5'-triphosphate,3'-diphosphate pyrophosphatase